MGNGVGVLRDEAEIAIAPAYAKVGDTSRQISGADQAITLQWQSVIRRGTLMIKIRRVGGNREPAGPLSL